MRIGALCLFTKYVSGMSDDAWMVGKLRGIEVCKNVVLFIHEESNVPFMHCMQIDEATAKYLLDNEKKIRCASYPLLVTAVNCVYVNGCGKMQTPSEHKDDVNRYMINIDTKAYSREAI